MSCLKNIVRAVILVFAIIGFKAAGGFDFIKKFHFFEKPSQEVMIEKCKEIADFSKIPDEYEIEKTANLLGYKGVLASHKASGQKLIVLEPKKKAFLTQKDFKNGSVKTKLSKLNEKFAYQYIRLENFEIVKEGRFQTMGQSVPYVKYEAEITNLPIKKIEGIIAVAKGKGESEKIILCAAQQGKYSQIITEQFFNKVK